MIYAHIYLYICVCVEFDQQGLEKELGSQRHISMLWQFLSCLACVDQIDNVKPPELETAQTCSNKKGQEPTQITITHRIPGVNHLPQNWRFVCHVCWLQL